MAELVAIKNHNSTKMPLVNAGGFKFLLIFAFLLALLQPNWAADGTEAAQKKIREDCIKEQGNLTPAEIQRVNEGKLVTKEKQEASQNLQCLLLCIYKKNGIISADGKENPEAFMKYMEHFVKDKSKMMPILASCASKKTGDACATVYNFESCVVEKA